MINELKSDIQYLKTTLKQIMEPINLVASWAVENLDLNNTVFHNWNNKRFMRPTIVPTTDHCVFSFCRFRFLFLRCYKRFIDHRYMCLTECLYISDRKSYYNLHKETLNRRKVNVALYTRILEKNKERRMMRDKRNNMR